MENHACDRQTGYPSVDRPWLQFYSEEVINDSIPDCSMYEYMVESTKSKDNKFCFNYFGKRITYREFYSQIDKVAAALTQMGLKQGDVVSICILTMPENYYLMYAINMLGGICNYIAVNNSADEMRKKIVNTDSKFVFTVNIAQKTILEAVKDISDITVISVPLYNSMPLITKALVKGKMKETLDNRILNWSEFLRKGNNTVFARPNIDGDYRIYQWYNRGI